MDTTTASTGASGSPKQTPPAKMIFFAALLTPIIAGLLIGGVVLAVNGSFSFGGSGSQHIRGSKRAPVKLVEFSDFECPFCGRHYPTLKQVLTEYGNKVSLEYKHFPLDFHPLAQPAALASECAAEQGKFWEYHDKIFENQEQLSAAMLKQWAADLKLNTNKFNTCLDSAKYASKVAADYAEGQAKGVNGTPATFVNGQLVSGAVPYEQIKQMIEAELQK